MSDELENGMEVYTEEGVKAEYLGKVENGHLVAPYVEAEDWESGYYSKPLGLRIVDKVFKSAPREIFDERIKELRSEIAAAEFKLDETKSDILDAMKERVRLVTKLAQVPALKRIEDFIEGRMTHFVLIEYRYEIKTLAELKESVDHRRDTKLLTLLGTTKGDLQWRINQYSDGSGSQYEIIPCASIEEAQEVRASRIQADMLAPASDRKFLTAVEAAFQCNVPVDADTMTKYRSKKLEGLEQQRKNTERDASTQALRLKDIDDQIAALRQPDVA